MAMLATLRRQVVLKQPRPCRPSAGEIRSFATEWRDSRARAGRDKARRLRETATSPARSGDFIITWFSSYPVRRKIHILLQLIGSRKCF